MAGCLDQCELGPMVVIYPQGIWYGRVQLEDVPRILDETVIGNRVLEDLRIADHLLNARPAPGPYAPPRGGILRPTTTEQYFGPLQQGRDGLTPPMRKTP